MTFPLLTALIALLGYVAGATPFGYLTARFIAGIDIRKEGSGNIGATNIGRVLGVKWGILVLLLDALKGLLPVLITPWLFPDFAAGRQSHLQVLCGICTIVGHMFPFWLRFRGGKGVATALGVIVAISPWATLAAFAIFLSVFLLWRIMSLSSLTAAIAYLITQMLLLKPHPFAEHNWSSSLFAVLIPALIFWRHRSNIGRLMRGEESRFQFRKKPMTDDDAQSNSGVSDDVPQSGDGG